MKFLVLNRSKAQAYSHAPHEESSILISIYSFDEGPAKIRRDPSNGIRACLPIQFDDVGPGEPGCMTEDNAQMIAQFLQRHLEKVDRVIVHCDAGVSRSAGICAAIMKAETGSDMDIFESGQYRPNMHCYRLLLSQLMA